jgi:uncharacterized protein
MSLSIYDSTVGTHRRMLGVLDSLLVKAAEHAEAGGYDATNLLGSRLAPDMFPLRRQVQIACDLAKSGGARLAGVPVPRHEDTETSIPELRTRIDKVLAFLDTLDRESINGAGEREIVVTVPGRELRFSGRDYVDIWLLPNFYFHLCMTYALLRHNGVALGKLDFLGG